VSAERPSQPEPRRLAEDQSLPGDFLVAFTEQLLDRRARLLRQGQPPTAAGERAVAEAVQTFTAGANQRGWTVGAGRITRLADDALGLEDEYCDQHGYEPELARLFATCEVLDGERARQELPARFLPPPDPPDHQERQPSERTGPDGRTDTVRTRDRGRER
jgi:hypothetical protein